MSRIQHFFVLVALVLCVFFLIGFQSVQAADSMAEYENLPPFSTVGVKSNVILTVDYSGSMQAPAYHNTDWASYIWNYDDWKPTYIANYGDGTLDEGTTSYEDCYVNGTDYNCTTIDNVEGPIADVQDSYDKDNNYYGYFDSDSYYRYHTDGYWETTTPVDDDRVGESDSISGNLLNFIIMSRVDVSLKALIGGKKEDCVGNTCLKPQGSKRYVELNDLECVAYVRPENPDSGTYSGKDLLVSIRDSADGNCPVDFSDSRRSRVKLTDEGEGVVQNNFDSVNFGLITYSGNTNGTIKHPVHNSSMSNLINALELAVPYGGTPTGEAMWETHNYLSQVTSYYYDADGKTHNYENNDKYIDDESEVDPYYKDTQPAWCRNSFVLLISDGVWNGDIDPVKPAHEMHTNDLRDDLKNNQTAEVYSLFAFSNDEQGENSMQAVSMYGNFQDQQNCTDEDWPYPVDSFPKEAGHSWHDGSKSVNFPISECDPDGTYDSCCTEWDEDDEDGYPDAYYSAEEGQEMAAALSEIFADIRYGASSGTSIASLTEERTSGDLINQAVFYPRKLFGEREVSWIGYLYTYWFLNEPNVQNLREDTENPKKLDILDDRILDFTSAQGDLEIDTYNSSRNGSRDEFQETYDGLDEMTPVWEAGIKLRDRNASDRTIYAHVNGSMENFTAANSDMFVANLGDDTTLYPDDFVNGSQPEYPELIRYVRGNNLNKGRSRCTGNGTWKLGDIIHSTPTTVEYGDYSLVFAGANDGMLHAFRLGKLMRKPDNMQPTQVCNSKSSSDDCSTDNLGREEWAFIPQNAMPYLRFMAHPNYSHINTVDLKPYVIEKQDGQKILIGGMRFGGGTGEVSNTDSVNPPSDTCSDPEIEDSGCTGRSAYFALDITNPQNPEHLWTFTDPKLGFSYSGPAYIKRKDSDGWHHYVMFASGPTSFDGKSKQDLRFFVLDLASGDLEYTHDKTNIGNAFGGRLFNNGLDVNGDDETDYVLIGYSRYKNNYSGGVFNIYTGEEDGEDVDPSSWEFNKNYVGFSSNPVVAKIASMKCFGQWYIYFGSGQYFVRDAKSLNNANHHLYGVPFDCKANGNCPTGTINSVNDNSNIDCGDIFMEDEQQNDAAWSVELKEAQGDYLRERSYANPSVTNFDTVLFNTAMPTAKVCEFGGQSRTWARNCATGWAMSNGTCENYAVDSGAFKYLVQLSGGDIQQYDPEDFSEGTPGLTSTTPGLVSEEGGVPMKGPSIEGEVLLWIEK